MSIFVRPSYLLLAQLLSVEDLDSILVFVFSTLSQLDFSIRSLSQGLDERILVDGLPLVQVSSLDGTSRSLHRFVLRSFGCLHVPPSDYQPTSLESHSDKHY